jgi:hypothetical protein
MRKTTKTPWNDTPRTLIWVTTTAYSPSCRPDTPCGQRLMSCEGTSGGQSATHKRPAHTSTCPFPGCAGIEDGSSIVRQPACGGDRAVQSSNGANRRRLPGDQHRLRRQCSCDHDGPQLHRSGDSPPGRSSKVAHGSPLPHRPLNSGGGFFLIGILLGG